MDGQRRSPGRLRAPDLRAVEVLCELVLTARRLGCTVVVVDPRPELRELIELAGLAEVLLGDGGHGAS